MASRIIVIPARLDSTRLPGKVLAKIYGKTMLEHVHLAAVAAHIGPVLVATNSPEIYSHVVKFGGIPVMTGPAESGTDRVQKAIDCFDPDEKYEVVVNLQADVPNITPIHICEAVSLLNAFDNCHIGTLVCKNDNQEHMKCASVVKAQGLTYPGYPNVIEVTSFNRRLKHSRYTQYEHIGIYAYRRHILTKFCNAEPTIPEQREKLEQLRALELGCRFYAAIIPDSLVNVDTPEDLERAREIMR